MLLINGLYQSPCRDRCYHAKVSGHQPDGSDCQGFVLCGGESRRMGRDKALLPWRHLPLVVQVARTVQETTGSATLVGPRERYAHLGWPIVEDRQPQQGPLAGLIAALATSHAKRCLIVACDMPWLSADGLRQLLNYSPMADVVVARGENGREPLCAVYHRRCLPTFEIALRQNERTVRRVLERLPVVEWPVPDPRLVTNANTPADWKLAHPSPEAET